jgi:hypothetical protein
MSHPQESSGQCPVDIVCLAHAHRFDQVTLDCLRGSVEHSLNVSCIDRHSKRFAFGCSVVRMQLAMWFTFQAALLVAS